MLKRIARLYAPDATAETSVIDAPPGKIEVSPLLKAFGDNYTPPPKDGVKTPEPKVEPEPPKVDAKTTPDPKDVAFTSKKAGDWKKVHDQIAELKTNSANLSKDLEAKIAELESLKKQPVIDPKELETLRGDRAKLEERLERVALEQSDRFSNHFNKLFGDAVAIGKEAAGDHAEQVEHLLNLPPSKARKEQIAQIMEQLPTDLDKHNLAAAVRQMDAARAEKNELLSKSKETLAKQREVETREMAERQNQQKSLRSAQVDAVLKQAGEYSAFAPLDGQAEHNMAITERQTRVRQFFTGELKAEELVKIPVLAEQAKFLTETVVPALKQEIEALRKANDELVKSGPGIKGDGDPNKGKTAPKTFTTVFKETFRPNG